LAHRGTAAVLHPGEANGFTDHFQWVDHHQTLSRNGADALLLPQAEEHA
jgi:hypothetical protein